jgi:hypothetical protein
MWPTIHPQNLGKPHRQVKWVGSQCHLLMWTKLKYGQSILCLNDNSSTTDMDSIVNPPIDKLKVWAHSTTYVLAKKHQQVVEQTKASTVYWFNVSVPIHPPLYQNNIWSQKHLWFKLRRDVQKHFYLSQS